MVPPMVAMDLVVVIVAQGIMAATPLAIAGLGEVIAQRAGTLNIGIEGLLLTGCIAGFATAALSGNGWLAVGMAMGGGTLLASLFALATVWGRCDQIVAGLALNLIAIGGSGVVWSQLQRHHLTTLPAGAGFHRGWGPTGAGDWPMLGPVVFHQYPLTWIVVAAALVVAWWLRTTRFGLVIRALGDDPDACAAAGIAVRRWRILAILAAGALAGLAGAFLAIMRTHSFVPMMSGGLGFVVLALVLFGRWHISGLLGGCLLFGVVDAIQQHIQAQPGASAVPFQLWQMLPYAASLAVIALMPRQRNTGPAALTRPW